MLNIINAKFLQLPTTPAQWLASLKGATAIEIEGMDSSQWRVISVLIHGNEPSGFFAAYNYLKQKQKPKTNLAIIISSVRAAKLVPMFSHRHVPGEFDLNRRFGFHNYHDQVTKAAHYITKYIRSLDPSLVVDLHNTSGTGPAFAVSISDHLSVQKISSLFSKQMIVTQLAVGSLMEQNFNCPVVTIESGHAQDNQAHKIASHGFLAFSNFHTMSQIDDSSMEIFYDPVRVVLQPRISIDYGKNINKDVDVTLIQNIDSLNFGIIQSGTTIGWLNKSLSQSLSANNDFNENIISHFFKVINQKLTLKRNARIFMATTNKEIVMEDCLFYIIKL